MALPNSAARPAPATTNQLRAEPAHRGEPANRSGPGAGPPATVVDPTWDHGTIAERGEKKGKVIQERKKLMVVVHARRGGGLGFAIDQMIEVS